MTTPVIASRSSPASVNRFLVSTPYSSTVCSRAVVNRQLAINSSPRNTPSTVLVLPTSIVSNVPESPKPRLLLCGKVLLQLSRDFRHITRNNGYNLAVILPHQQQP